MIRGLLLFFRFYEMIALHNFLLTLWNIAWLFTDFIDIFLNVGEKLTEDPGRDTVEINSSVHGEFYLFPLFSYLGGAAMDLLLQSIDFILCISHGSRFLVPWRPLNKFYYLIDIRVLIL